MLRCPAFAGVFREVGRFQEFAMNGRSFFKYIFSIGIVLGSAQFFEPAAEAGAVSTTNATYVYPARNVRAATGKGNLFLGNGEKFVKVEMLYKRLDGSTGVVAASPSGSTWSGGTPYWTSANSGTQTVVFVKARFTYKDKSNNQKVYTEADWRPVR